MAQAPSADKADLDFLYDNLAEYLDGELTGEVLKRVEALAKQPGMESIPAQFKSTRGRLQLAMQSYYLKDDEVAVLRAYVQDPSVTATKENVRIEQLGRGEVVSTLLRRLVMVAIGLGLVGAAVWKFGMKHEQTFKPLEYLGYEALALEDNPNGRLNLPTHDLKEIRQYLTNYPGLDFKPRVLKSVPEPLRPDGATVIDYEIAKVAAVAYGHPQTREKLIYFNFAGALKDLPPAEAGNIKGMIFQTYASDELNLIAWDVSPGVVALLVGRRSAMELATIALEGSRKD